MESVEDMLSPAQLERLALLIEEASAKKKY